MRPWPLSTVWCGGGKSGVLYESYIIKEVFLILFDNKKVVGVFFFDNVTRCVDLGVHSIGCNNSTVYVQRGEKFCSHGNFVCFFTNLNLPDGDGLLMKKGTEEMDLCAIFPACAFEGFAIESDSLVLSGLHQPATEMEFHRFNVSGLEDTTKGSLGRRHENTRFSVSASA